MILRPEGSLHAVGGPEHLVPACISNFDHGVWLTTDMVAGEADVIFGVPVSAQEDMVED